MKYMVFNPILGQHTEANTEEEAIEFRKLFITDFVDKNIHMFSIARVETDDDGNDTWSNLEVTNGFTLTIL